MRRWTSILSVMLDLDRCRRLCPRTRRRQDNWADVDDDEAMRPLIALASLVVMVGGAAPARAEPGSTDSGTDANFLAALRQAGITYNSGDTAVAAAKAACGLIDQGQPQIDVVKHVTEQNPGFTISGAAKFTAIAASAYCPQYLNAVRDSGGGDSGGDNGAT
jgi:hypothetical protein